jgi:D-alanyl-lipoteichoic acid acyltransferase DltB (MBOAT superfamily)
LTAAAAWLSVLAYTMQIYFDFSGYTDMALGAARLFNIRMPINFDSPYRATDIRDFWHRWHITLSRFLREYLYLPLGGNRRGTARTAANLMVTFLLGGLWHGAAWTFVAWGALHGGGLCVQRAWRRTGVALPAPLAWAITFGFVVVAWVFFRAASLADAFALLQAMAGANGLATPGSGIGDALVRAFAPAGIGGWGAAALAAGAVIASRPRNSHRMALAFRPTALNGALACAALAAAVLQFGRITPFLYFNF